MMRPLTIITILTVSTGWVLGSDVNEWALERAVPTSTVVWADSYAFSHCLTAGGGGHPWHECSDKHPFQALTDQTVTDRVTKSFTFTVDRPGFLYIVLETQVDAKYPIYENISYATWQRTKDGWQVLWLRLAEYSAYFHGSKAHHPNQESKKVIAGAVPFDVTRNPDGSLATPLRLPHTEGGEFRIDFRAANRFLPDNWEKTYYPSKVKAAIYLIPDKPLPSDDCPNHPRLGADGDADGVPDWLDACPAVRGEKSMLGCTPELFLPKLADKSELLFPAAVAGVHGLFGSTQRRASRSGPQVRIRSESRVCQRDHRPSGSKRLGPVLGCHDARQMHGDVSHFIPS